MARDPIGANGGRTVRDAHGRFATGDQSAVVVGEHSERFWEFQEAARLAIVRGVLADAGQDVEHPPVALRLAAEGLAQSAIVRDSAFARIVESGGPLTAAGRSRRAYNVWRDSLGQVERHVRTIGLGRAPRSISEERVVAFAGKVGQIIAETVTDHEQLALLKKRLREELGWTGAQAGAETEQ